MDAARQTIVEVREREFQLPADGEGIPRRSYTSRRIAAMKRVCARTVSRAARERVRWHREVTEKWPQVNFVDFGIGAGNGFRPDRPCRCGPAVDLAGLDARRCPRGSGGGTGGRRRRTGGYAGPDAGARWNNTESVFMFGRDFAPFTTGRLGYSLRVSPNHCDDPLNRPCNAPIKWAASESLD